MKIWAEKSQRFHVKNSFGESPKAREPPKCHDPTRIDSRKIVKIWAEKSQRFHGKKYDDQKKLFNGL